MKSNSDIQQLIDIFPLISNQITKAELSVLLTKLKQVIEQGIPGDIVELGCYEGTAALFMQRLLLPTNRRLWLYDSFAGLPEKTLHDSSPAGQQFKAGELTASKKQLLLNFRKAGLPKPVVKKAWFKDLTAEDMPEQIALAFLDGDFYRSIKDSLILVGGKVSPAGVIIVDDYQSESLPGVKTAVTEWIKSKNWNLTVAHSLAVIQAPS